MSRIDHRRAPGVARGRRALAVGAALALSLSACTQVPTSSPVATSEPLSGQQFEEEIPLYLPPEPRDDATPTEIIRGFINAGVGPQDDYRVARAYLTEAAQSTWAPGQRTVIYSATPTITATEDDGVFMIQVEVDSVVDAFGVRTVTAPGTTQAWTVEVVDDAGQPRIDSTAPGTLLSTDQFTALYAPHELYFFDPTMTFAVPDPRWFINRGSAAGAMMSALLNGPAEPLAGAVVSAFPTGSAAALSRPSVPVSEGVASVDLAASAVEGADEARRTSLRHQIELTLMGLPSVDSVDITVDLDPLTVRNDGADTTRPVQNPTSGSVQVAVDTATQNLVFFQGLTVSTVGGLPDVGQLNPVAPTMNRARTEFAFLTQDGRSLYTASTDGGLQRVVDGVNLSEPSIDGLDWLWTVDRGQGSQIRAVPLAGTGVEASRQISVPWLGQTQEISALQVAPDGARAALLVRDGDETTLSVAGVVRGEDGVPTALTEPVTYHSEANVADVVWVDEITLLAAGQADAPSDVIEPQLISLDGNRRSLTPLSGIINITAGGSNTYYAETAESIYLLVGASWRSQELPRGVRDISYSG
ncbi:MAG: LpqB family beta-propeller domain-containing protein [Micrococcus sp.]|nr:LpqB family beta-propeller domain-containing protein [Micrococcus sp.]